VTATSLLIATTTSVVVTSVHVVVSTVLVLVVVSLVPSHVLIWHVMRANNPFFFRSNLSDKFVDLLLSFGGIDVAVLYPLQVILKSVNSISYVVARLLPVEHLGLFTAESFVFKLLLGNPEFNSEGLVGEEIALIKVLDSGLCGLDIIVKNKTLLVGSNLYVGVDSEFYRDDSSVFAEQIYHLLLRDSCGNIFDEKVRIKGLGEGLSNRSSFSLGNYFVFSL
jgi:hypothetical protein